MVVSIDTKRCIGCGVCVQISPDVFSMDEDAGVAKVIRPEGYNKEEQKAAQVCPVSCISVKES